MVVMFYQWNILNLESWWMLVIALVFCAGVINAFNFMDGINGINSGYGLHHNILLLSGKICVASVLYL